MTELGLDGAYYGTRDKGGNHGNGWAREPDPKACLQDCKKQHLDSYLTSWEIDMMPLCNAAAAGEEAARDMFWPLYWCDAAFCGVYIDATGDIGQDRESPHFHFTDSEPCLCCCPFLSFFLFFCPLHIYLSLSLYFFS
jgi:hypothetical protein